MKIASNFSTPALALLVNLMLGTAGVWAQSAPGNAIPPAAPPAAAQPSPLPARLIEDRTAPAGWKRYEVGGARGFSLFLPGAPPQADAKVFEPSTEREMTVRTYVSPTDTGGYEATFMEMPRAFDSSTDAKRRVFFTKFVEGFVDGFQRGARAQGITFELKLLELRRTTADGLAGYEQDLTFGPLAGRVRLVFADRHAYGMNALWNGLVSAGERNNFFDSFRVNGKR